jgi:hypothetical protein
MEYKELDILIEKFENGTSSLDEENRLASLLNKEGLPLKYKKYQVFFHQMNTMEASLLEASEEFWMDETHLLNEESTAKIIPFPINNWRIGIAASIALFILSGFLGWYLGVSQQKKVHAGHLENEVLEIKQMLLKSQVEPLSPSYRIDLVNQMIEAPMINQELLTTLTEILNYDKNTNVRIAALEGLSKYINQIEVQQVLIQSLGQQTDPNMQMALIGILTEQDIQQAKPALENLLDEENILDFVKEQATMTLKNL